MPFRRSAASTAVAGMIAVALVTAIVLSAVESRSHKHPAKSPAAAPATTLSDVERRSIAHELSTMSLPKGLRHTTVCPQQATHVDACFASRPAAAARSNLNAADEAQRFLTSLTIVLAPHQSCYEIAGGPQGSGYSCQNTGTWKGATVSSNVFLSDSNAEGKPFIDGIVTVLADKPS